MSSFPRATLRDVAKLAGVSIATASRALSNPGLVADGTRISVRDAAECCGYTVNLVARSLRMQRTNTILLLAPCIDSPFYPAIIRAMEETAHDHGFSIIIGLTAKATEKRQSYSDLLNNSRVDGVVVIDGGNQTIALTGPRPAIPVVQVLEMIYGASIAAVRVDDRKVADIAVRHLAGLGHRRIAHIAGGPHSIATEERIEGYRAALSSLGLSAPGYYIRPGNYTREQGRAAMRDLLAVRDPPTAVFCANDSSACGAIQACQEKALRIPRDISIIGVDDTIDGRYCQPPLTTVQMPLNDIGVEAILKLIALIRGGSQAVTESVLPVKLLVRGSTAAPGKNPEPHFS